ncbi:MAG: hypothetical protein CNLJKLNK_01302 [Holosporales bacterium]
MKYFSFFFYLIVQSEVFSADFNAVANQIIVGKVGYCDITSQIRDQTEKERFYAHVAEQHFGIGIDSYARYSGNPPGGIEKLLRSEFELHSSTVSPQFDLMRDHVVQGARCLWFKEIFDAHLKPFVENITSSITPLLKNINELNTKVQNRDLDVLNADLIIQKQHKRISMNIKNIIKNLNDIKANMTLYLPIMSSILPCCDNFFNNNVGDTKIAMNSVLVDIQGFLGAIDSYVATCQNIDNDNGTGAIPNTPSVLSLSILQTLLTIDLSKFGQILKLLQDHVFYVRESFSTVKNEGMGIAKSLFENILETGVLQSNGPHADPQINLFYKYTDQNLRMKAELDVHAPNSSWYDITTNQLIDRRILADKVSIGFSFISNILYYGTMFPVK